MAKKTPSPRRRAERRGSRPLYREVKERLLQRLAEEYWRPGQMLPSEPRLAAEFGVSQGTMRRALDAPR